jgi:cbb3-type cytochrome oxidase subunit 3
MQYMVDYMDMTVEMMWVVIIMLAVFIIAYIYYMLVHGKKQTALKESNMYKRLQLLSSAAFSCPKITVVSTIVTKSRSIFFMITNLYFKDIISQLFLFLNIMNGKNILLLKILLVNSLYGFEKKVDNNVCVFAFCRVCKFCIGPALYIY